MKPYNNHRVKERYIWEVMEKVDQWRLLFKDGIRTQNGDHERLSLNQAAEVVGIPRRTLEGYQQLLKKCSELIQLSQVCHLKIGYLRKIEREAMKNRSKNYKQIYDISNSSEEEQQSQMLKQTTFSETLDQNQTEQTDEIFGENFYQQQSLQQQQQYSDNWQQMILDGPIDSNLQQLEYSIIMDQCDVAPQQLNSLNQQNSINFINDEEDDTLYKPDEIDNFNDCYFECENQDKLDVDILEEKNKMEQEFELNYFQEIDIDQNFDYYDNQDDSDMEYIYLQNNYF